MPVYNAPVRDMRFVFYELLDGACLQQLPGFEEVDEETVIAILDEAGRFCEEQLLPINRSGDEEACAFDEGSVKTPAGFREAYNAFIEAGWNSIALDPEYGGQGLPKSLHIMVDEMLNATNISFSLYPGLTHGAWTALAAYADDELKARYFPKMAEGTWSGTMCLTEPQSGTDLALLRTRAEPREDGSYLITGSKIFITGGEQDLTENIIHLVLARMPDAPPGIKGISLFLVPKFVTDDQGRLGARNPVFCGSIEHKMGIKASATCTMNFDGAQGWLVGQPHRGMQAMFKMMNTERLAVGVQGIGVAEAAYQNAVTYARERLQGRNPRGAEQPEKNADPLTVHPDIRRMLLTMRANVEGMRAMALWIARELDISVRHPEPERRNRAADFVMLMTPVAKAFFTDLGSETANLGVQVFGGHGYIREHGMEQLVRDARIAQLYEGTNGVQAMDLAGRKLFMEEGNLIRVLLDPISSYIDSSSSNAKLEPFIQPLQTAVIQLQRATETILRRGVEDPAEIGAAATPYLRLTGLTAMGYLWARMAELGLEKAESGEARFYQAKVRTACFFMEHLLPQTAGLATTIEAGASALMDFDDEAW